MQKMTKVSSQLKIEQELKCRDTCFGLSLRHQYFADMHALSTLPCLEILGDNIMEHRGGPALANTDLLAERAKILVHTVGLNIGGFAPLDWQYIKKLQILLSRYQPLVVSDHLCFTRGSSHNSYDLLPLARTQHSIQNVSARIDALQNFLGRQICLENISAYLGYHVDEMSEGEFLSAIVRKTGCGVLLDINNLYVNSANLGFDPFLEVLRYPLAAVCQIHLAGHLDDGMVLLDTHDQPICLAVISLAKHVIPLLRQDIPIVLEWDGEEMPFVDLWGEFERMQKSLAV